MDKNVSVFWHFQGIKYNCLWTFCVISLNNISILLYFNKGKKKRLLSVSCVGKILKFFDKLLLMMNKYIFIRQRWNGENSDNSFEDVLSQPTSHLLDKPVLHKVVCCSSLLYLRNRQNFPPLEGKAVALHISKIISLDYKDCAWRSYFFDLFCLVMF